MSNRDAQTILGMARETKELQTKLDEAEGRLNNLVNDVLDLAPECWDGDVSAESLVIDFVSSLVNGTTTHPGHRDECNCWA